jgi:hypothetical protein
MYNITVYIAQDCVAFFEILDEYYNNCQLPYSPKTETLIYKYETLLINANALHTVLLENKLIPS